jgi:hypothetical protein
VDGITDFDGAGVANDGFPFGACGNVLAGCHVFLTQRTRRDSNVWI